MVATAIRRLRQREVPHTLLHLYDENGDQLDRNGHFPNVKWETIGHPPAAMVDSDDFWNTIESMRFATEK